MTKDINSNISINIDFNITIWLFNIAMENPENQWRLMSLGKSSISIRAMASMAMLVITRWCIRSHGLRTEINNSPLVNW